MNWIAIPDSMNPPSDVNGLAAKAIDELRSHANPANVDGMRRYGISVENALGVSMPIIREIAKAMGRDHQLAQLVWPADSMKRGSLQA